MANWIKVGKETPDKPEIAVLARKLGITHAEAFVEWFRVYTWADGITTDGRVPFLSLEDGDRLSRCRPGTFVALASPEIGWVIVDGDGFRFDKWDRHNGKCAKTRALEAEKKRKQREESRDCPDDNGTNKGLEEIREEVTKKESTNVDSSVQDEPAPPHPSEFTFPTTSGRLWPMPQLVADQYQATYGDRIDLRREFGKARQWLMDNKTRRPKGATGMRQFLTRWMNRADEHRQEVKENEPPAMNGENRKYNMETGRWYTPVKGGEQ